MVQWLERGALPREFKTPLGQVFFSQRNIMFLPHQRWYIISMFVSLGKALHNDVLHFTEV